MLALQEKKEYIFTEETVASISELVNVFRGIDKRLKSEGYTMKDGKYIKPYGTGKIRRTNTKRNIIG